MGFRGLEEGLGEGIRFRGLRRPPGLSLLEDPGHTLGSWVTMRPVCVCVSVSTRGNDDVYHCSSQRGEFWSEFCALSFPG